MYVCDSCFKEEPRLQRGAMTARGSCEWCGIFHDRWGDKFVQWVKNVCRPVGHANPKKYVLDQLGDIYVDEALVDAGIRIAHRQLQMIRTFMEGFRKAHADNEDPYKKGWHDALQFMVKAIDENLEREPA